MDKLDDAYILNIYRNKNPNYAFNLLVREYQKRLYFHIRRVVLTHEDTDDVLQNTFLKVWKGLPKFKENSKLSTWLYTIATNESLTHIKRNKKRFETISLDITNDQHAPTYISSDEIQLKLEKAILTLPEKQRIVFHLKYFEDLKYSEISEITGTSIGGLKASYHLAVKKIEKNLTQD